MIFANTSTALVVWKQENKSSISHLSDIYAKVMVKSFPEHIQSCLVKLSVGVVMFLTCPLKGCSQQLSCVVHRPPGCRRLALALLMPTCPPVLPGEQDETEGPCFPHISAVLQVVFFCRIILHYLIAIKQPVSNRCFQICFIFCQAETTLQDELQGLSVKLVKVI